MNAQMTLKANHRETIDSYLGMTIAIGAFAMFFGSLFVAYLVLRLRQAQWPPPGLPPFPQTLPLVNTVILLASSFFMHLATKKIEAANNRGFGLFLGFTILAGVAFLGLQVLLWQNVSDLGIQVSSGALGSIFYGMTMLHAVHLVAGVLALLYLVPGAIRGTFLERGTIPVRMVGIFWHFLDIVWIILYFAIFIV